jgi:hypothetical protein
MLTGQKQNSHLQTPEFRSKSVSATTHTATTEPIELRGERGDECLSVQNGRQDSV